MTAQDPEEMLDYCTEVCRSVVTHREFRHNVSVYKKKKNPLHTKKITKYF